MKQMRRMLILIITAAWAAVLAGCGCGRAAESSAAKTEGYYSSNGYAMQDAAYESGEYEEEYLYDEEPSAAPLPTGSGLLKTEQQAGEKLIYTGNLRMQTLEYDQTIDSIHKMIRDCGGFIQYEDESDGNYSWYYSDSSSARSAEIQARIPSESFDTFVGSLESCGKVLNRHVSVDNVSQTYADKEATAKAYEVERDRLLKMMDKAETIEDMIAVEARLSEVESELNMYKTDLAALDRDIQYSTIHISVEEVRKYTEKKDESTFISRLKETIRSSWSGFRKFLEGFLHLIIYVFPFLVLALAVFLIIRAIKRKRDAKRPERLARKQEKKLQKKQMKQQHKMEKMERKQQKMQIKQETLQIKRQYSEQSNQKAGDEDEQGISKDV